LIQYLAVFSILYYFPCHSNLLCFGEW
jgi:hypothetical protein